MLINYEKIEANERKKLMAGSIIPRSIAWIVTKDLNNIVNVAPFSYFTGLSSNPPTLIVSIGHKSDGTPKDTLKNIRETKKCTICLPKEENLKKMHWTSKELDNCIDEAKEFDIKLQEIEKDFPPMIKGVPLSFFCNLYQEIDLKESMTIPLILEIKKEYIDDNNIDEKSRITFKPIARVGGNYAFLSKYIDIPKIP